jgi:YidC/Oxa1 family membrane protein insertase
VNWFVGPKDLDILRSVNPKLEQMVDWGWFWFLAKPLFRGLHWLHDSYIHNWGWSIVVVTILINLLMLPLKFSSLQSSRKLSALAPELKAINEKYKGISVRDPRKQQQNEEVMALYKKHGVNPLGGCVPLLLQIPVFIAFYKVLTVAIELRGADWLWVTDLSRPETLPLRVLPILMIVTQFILQKMTPSPGMDPAQQRIMLMMPLFLGYMFYYQSAGLVLYWLTGNLVGIIQQWIINRMSPAPAANPVVAARKKGK